MSSVEGHESDPKQPTITAEGGFIWPGDEGCKRKPAPGEFVMSKYLTPTTIGGKSKRPEFSTRCSVATPVY